MLLPASETSYYKLPHLPEACLASPSAATCHLPSLTVFHRPAKAHEHMCLWLHVSFNGRTALSYNFKITIIC